MSVGGNPVPANLVNKVYITNGNAVFELNYSSIDSFQNSANYAVAVAGRLDQSDTSNSFVLHSELEGKRRSKNTSQ